MVAVLNAPKKTIRKRKVPDSLVKEEINGIRFYYANYKDVLNYKKTEEEIMGCSGIQALLIEYLMTVLITSGIQKKYRVFTNETGNHIAYKNNISFDIALYDRAVLTPEKINNKYVQETPPHIVIEIDTDISLDETGFSSMQDYYFAKTRKLLEYGTQKVIWIFTKGKKIMVAEGKDWMMYDFDKTVQIIDNVTFNLDDFLKEENIIF